MTALPSPATPPLWPTPTPNGERRSIFARLLDRCAAAGLRVVIKAPADVTTFQRGIAHFPERRIEPPAHASWETAYRVFCNRGRQPHDRGSWHILVVKSDDEVVGAVTARFFCGNFVPAYLHTLSLLETTGPVFREHCELAVDELLAATAREGRTAAEVSHANVAPGRRARVVALTLAQALAVLSSAFRAPLALFAADHRKGDVARLLRFGAAPLGRAGKFSLPPFVHHASGAWLRLLLIDGPLHQGRAGLQPEDLALLRARCPVISLA